MICSTKDICYGKLILILPDKEVDCTLVIEKKPSEGKIEPYCNEENWCSSWKGAAVTRNASG